MLHNPQCPNCGSVIYTFDLLGEISSRQLILSILTFGLYDPWRKMYDRSAFAFKSGTTQATCEICRCRFMASDKIDRAQLSQNERIRLEGEKRLLLEKEQLEFIYRNYPYR